MFHCFTFTVWKQHSFRCKWCAPHPVGTCRRRGVVACLKGKQWSQPRQRPFWWCKHQCLCTWRPPEQTKKRWGRWNGCYAQKATWHIMIASMYHSWIVIFHINWKKHDVIFQNLSTYCPKFPKDFLFCTSYSPHIFQQPPSIIQPLPYSPLLWIHLGIVIQLILRPTLMNNPYAAHL